MIGWHNWNASPAFQGFQPRLYAHDSPEVVRSHADPMWEPLISRLRPRVVVEVGTFRGFTAVAMADAVLKHGLATKVVCIDTWLGSPEHWAPIDDFWRIDTQFGYPILYWRFASNIVSAGVQDVVVPLPTTSESGAYILTKAGITPELIYVDAAHEYDSAKADFHRYWNLLPEGGVLVGDDYNAPGWDGVTQAANEFAAEVGAPMSAFRTKFVVRKGGSPLTFDRNGILIAF